MNCSGLFHFINKAASLSRLAREGRLLLFFICLILIPSETRASDTLGGENTMKIEYMIVILFGVSV